MRRELIFEEQGVWVWIWFSWLLDRIQLRGFMNMEINFWVP